MSVTIGHARISEHGTVTGTAGDQNGAEVRTQPWWNQGWNCVLRPKSADVAEKSAKFVEQVCANDKVGYDQYERNTLRTYAKKHGWDGSAITEACETDCCAFMAVAAEAAGVNVDCMYNQGNAPCTSWQANSFKQTGAYDVLRESKYLTSDSYLLRGDILVDEDAHTVMVLSNGSASGSEKRSGCGASSGVNYSSEIAAFQSWLNATYHVNIGVDGEFGPETKAAAEKAKDIAMTVGTGSGMCKDGPLVYITQGMLYCNGFDPKGFDGECGSGCSSAIGEYQTKVGLGRDNEAGEKTFAKLFS